MPLHFVRYFSYRNTDGQREGKAIHIVLSGETNRGLKVLGQFILTSVGYAATFMNINTMCLVGLFSISE